MTDEQYYNNQDAHGKYQYVSLKEIIDNMLMESQNEDGYLKNIKRYNLVRYAKNMINDLNKSIVSDVLAFEITISNNLTVILPPDFVNYVRVSVVEVLPEGAYRLRPLDINYKMNIALGYLQDHDLNLIFDESGNIVTANGLNAYGTPYKTFTFCESSCSGSISKEEFTPYGMFNIDRREGKIVFSSNLLEKNVVIEYVSDGKSFDDSEITIHKDLQQVIEDWIYYASISKLKNVPFNEKMRAKRRYDAELHKAKLKAAEITPARISRIL